MTKQKPPKNTKEPQTTKTTKKKKKTHTKPNPNQTNNPKTNQTTLPQRTSLSSQWWYLRFSVTPVVAPEVLDGPNYSISGSQRPKPCHLRFSVTPIVAPQILSGSSLDKSLPKQTVKFLTILGWLFIGPATHSSQNLAVGQVWVLRYSMLSSIGPTVTMRHSEMDAHSNAISGRSIPL